MPDKSERDTFFEKNFHRRGFKPKFHAHWTNDDILSARVTRLNFKESNIIQYEVTLTQDVTDPRLFVDLLRRCKNVQEGRKETSAVTGQSTHGIEERTKTNGLQTQAITVN